MTTRLQPHKHNPCVAPCMATTRVAHPRSLTSASCRRASVARSRTDAASRARVASSASRRARSTRSCSVPTSWDLAVTSIARDLARRCSSASLPCKRGRDGRHPDSGTRSCRDRAHRRGPSAVRRPHLQLRHAPLRRRRPPPPLLNPSPRFLRRLRPRRLRRSLRLVRPRLRRPRLSCRSAVGTCCVVTLSLGGPQQRLETRGLGRADAALLGELPRHRVRSGHHPRHLRCHRRSARLRDRAGVRQVVGNAIVGIRK